jgi:hypothetical protein
MCIEFVNKTTLLFTPHNHLKLEENSVKVIYFTEQNTPIPQAYPTGSNAYVCMLLTRKQLSAHCTRLLNYIRVFQTSWLVEPLWHRKTTLDPHILAHVTIQCPDNEYPKLKICISELILGSYDYTPVAQIDLY